MRTVFRSRIQLINLFVSRHKPQYPRSCKRASSAKVGSKPTSNRPIRSTPPPPAPVRSDLGGTGLILAAVVSGLAAYIVSTQIPKGNTPAPIEQSSQAQTAQYSTPDMAPQVPPGRPGNLTSDQETKLKEMWAATLDIFGLAHEEAQSNGTTTPSSTNVADPKKKKKSRLSILKRKHKDGTNGEVDGASGDSEADKYGQTKEFQQALASQTPEQLREAFWSMTKHDHPDALLLRFLRARKWDVHAALIMLISTMHWMSTDMRVEEEIMKPGEGHALMESKSLNSAEKKEGNDFLSQLRMGKSFLHGTDKEGRPCCYVRVRLHRPGEQSEKSLEKVTVYTIETTRLMIRPPVDTATIVFDMTDFSLANMDYTPVKFMIKCFEANYPESLGSVVVYRSPWIFTSIWKIIKGWLDPVVAAKVHFASNVEELQEWIPKSQILKELGGDDAYTYTYVEPVEGENAQMADTASRDKILDQRRELVKSYEGETLAWVHSEDKGDGRDRLAQRLAENYWQLDPFVRARSLYDRLGVLGPGGKLEFYPKSSRQHSANDVD